MNELKISREEAKSRGRKKAAIRRAGGVNITQRRYLRTINCLPGEKTGKFRRFCRLLPAKQLRKERGLTSRDRAYRKLVMFRVR